MGLCLDVYQFLVEHTCEVSDEIETDKAIYYSEYIEIEDIWDTEKYQLFIQKGNNLGDRMAHAFEKAFEQSYDKVILIGSDCFEISKDHINNGFEALNNHEFVVGPAKDGGYYLIGMNAHHPELFKDKKYGHAEVLNDLMTAIADKPFELLETLSDIDTFQDLKDSKIDFQFVDPDEEDS